MRMIMKAGLCAFALLFTAFGAISQNNSSQVVFSDTGATMYLTGNSKASTPYGFWIWCNPQAAPGSNGTYTGACNGSMYFYKLQTSATSIVGYVGGSDGIYTMTVFPGTFAEFKQGKINFQFFCTLTNTAPVVNGPGNTVLVNCMFPNSEGGGETTPPGSTDTGVVATVTGPSN